MIRNSNLSMITVVGKISTRKIQLWGLVRENNRRKVRESSIKKGKDKGDKINGFPHMHLKVREIVKKWYHANLFLQPLKEMKLVMRLRGHFPIYQKHCISLPLSKLMDKSRFWRTWRGEVYGMKSSMIWIN